MSSADPKTPLEGLLVVEVGDGLAGAATAQALGDLGAEVVKMEDPAGGDPARHLPGPAAESGASAPFLAYNRNKRSLAIDLVAAKDLLADMVAKADVLVDSLSPATRRAAGLEPGSLAEILPRLVHCTITPYGDDPEVEGRGHADPVLQAESGFMSINGHRDGPPLHSGVPVVDLTSAFAASQGILAALYEREESGLGQRVEIVGFDVALADTYHFGLQYLVDGKTPERWGNGSPAAAPVGVVRASDGMFQMTIAGERVWRKLCEDVLGRPDLMERPEFATNADRVANRDALHAVLDEILLTDTRDGWVERLRAAGAPGGAIRDVGEAVDSPEVQERGLVGKALHATGEVPVVMNPIRFAGTPVAAPRGAPRLGADGRDVLTRHLGLDEATIANLARAGAIDLPEDR